jgi:hypothetical protein
MILDFGSFRIASGMHFDIFIEHTIHMRLPTGAKTLKKMKTSNLYPIEIRFLLITSLERSRCTNE